MTKLPILLAAIAAPGACLAQTSAPPTASEVVVTATGVPTLQSEAPEAEVIDRAEIDALQAVFIEDVLAIQPGLTIWSDGAFGGVASVSLWGASSDKTLVVLDGVPQNDPSDPNGAYDFSSLDLSDVERIEILQGPQSSIWGSDAIGGVIAITRREIDGWRLSGEGGSLATFDGSAAFGRRTDEWAYGVSVFGDRSNGVAKADGIGPANPYRDWSASGYARLSPTGWLDLDAHARFDDSNASIDGYNAITGAFGYTPQFSAEQSWTGDLRAVAKAPWGFTDTLSAGFAELDRSDVYIGQPADSSSYWALTQDYRVSAEKGAAEDRYGVTVGAERLATDASLSTGAHESQGTTSGFAVARVRPWSALTLTGSERYDATDSYGSAATGRAAAVLRLPDGLSLNAAWGQGFKTPTISEIACDFCYPAGPSVGLKPEHAVGWDAGAAWTSPDGAVTARVLAYHLSVRDQIEYAATFPFRYGNVSATRSDGFEAQLEARLTSDLRLLAEYAYLDAVDLQTETPMLRIPRDSGSAELFWSHGRWRAAASVRSEGPDADINPSSFLPQTRPGFLLANLDGAYEVNRHFELTARVTDVADAHYEEVLGYGEPRRMILIGFRARG